MRETRRTVHDAGDPIRRLGHQRARVVSRDARPTERRGPGQGQHRRGRRVEREQRGIRADGDERRERQGGRRQPGVRAVGPDRPRSQPPGDREEERGRYEDVQARGAREEELLAREAEEERGEQHRDRRTHRANGHCR